MSPRRNKGGRNPVGTIAAAIDGVATMRWREKTRIDNDKMERRDNTRLYF